MANKNKNTGIVYTNEEKCIGCNRCIDGCPVPAANVLYLVDGESKIYVDSEKCIHCGHCFDYCMHNAREYRDDTDKFFDDLKHGTKISLLVAPSIRTNFPDNYKKLLGYFNAAGINHIYDVSFGANITIWAYLKYIENNNNAKSIITQPCPVVVNNIEKFNTELIPNLVPIQSPMMCAAIYMKEYMNISDKIAFISPCIAKKDEIDDVNTNGYVSYNVTFKKLAEYFEKNHIDINEYEEDNYDEARCGLGAIFSRPGGLRENIEFYNNDLWVKQVGGFKLSSDYLKLYSHRMHEDKILPQIVDILNCEKGCNIGTAAINGVEEDDDADYIMHSKKNEAENDKKQTYELFKEFDKTLDLKKFERKYTNKKIESYMPSEEEINEIFNSMLKEDERERNINCNSCGYNSCRDMAVAIFQNINLKESCIRYDKKILEIEKEKLKEKEKELTNSFEKIQAQNNTIRAMSTPTIKLWDGILVLPVVGVVDSMRAQNMMDSILNKIAETPSKVVVIDIHGVAAIDTAVANHIIKITKAAKMMGTECLLSGISPVVAQTIIQLGIDMSMIKTTSTLSDALAEAFSIIKLKVVNSDYQRYNLRRG